MSCVSTQIAQENLKLKDKHHTKLGEMTVKTISSLANSENTTNQELVTHQTNCSAADVISSFPIWPPPPLHSPPRAYIAHAEHGCRVCQCTWETLWKISPHLGRVDSDGLATAQRRAALWVSLLFQWMQGTDVLKCGALQSGDPAA